MPPFWRDPSFQHPSRLPGPSLDPFAEALRRLPFSELRDLAALRLAVVAEGLFEGAALAVAAAGNGHAHSTSITEGDIIPLAGRDRPIDYLMGILEDGRNSKPGGRPGDRASRLRAILMEKIKMQRPEILTLDALTETLQRCAGKWFKVAHLEMRDFEALEPSQWETLVNALADKITAFRDMGITEYTLRNSLHRHSTATLEQLVKAKYPWGVIALAVQSENPIQRAKELTDLKSTAAEVARQHPDSLIQKLAGTIGRKAATQQADTSESVQAKARRYIEFALAVQAYIRALQNPLFANLVEPIARAVITHGPKTVDEATAFAQSLIEVVLATSAEFDRRLPSTVGRLRERLLEDTVSMGVSDLKRVTAHVVWWLTKHAGDGAATLPAIPSTAPTTATSTSPNGTTNGATMAVPQKSSAPPPINGVVPIGHVASFLSTRFNGTVTTAEVERGIRGMLSQTPWKSIQIQSIQVAQIELHRNGTGWEEVILHIQFSCTNLPGKVTVRGKVTASGPAQEFSEARKSWITIKSITVTLFE